MDKKEIISQLAEIRSFILKEMNSSGGVVFDFSSSKVGDIITINTKIVSLSVKKIGENLYEVVDNGESTKIKEGDILRIEGDNVVYSGGKINFKIFRDINIDYKTDPIDSINS